MSGTQMLPWSNTDLIYSRSQFLRGWLSEEETRELLAQCCEDDISLHGQFVLISIPHYSW